MLDVLVVICVIVPFLAAAAVWLDKSGVLGKLLVPVTGLVLAVASVILFFQGDFILNADSFLGGRLDSLILLLDFLLLVYLGYLGYSKKNNFITVMAGLQFAGMAVLEIMAPAAGPNTPGFYADSLSLTMVLIISIVGSIICYYGLGYMEEHERHLHLETTRKPRFFFFMLAFLGAMNGLVLSNNMAWLYFFWEVTTLCSYMLIRHDATEVSEKNASTALWMNMLGGVGFVLGLLMLQKGMSQLSLTALLNSGAGGRMVVLPLVALCFAGFTKAAQAPFQSWLTGAMVAPTPVSALLHSSTMVKAGVYLILRISPAFAANNLSALVALFGALTFVSMAGLAVGQSNGKKILAYSTISNLGLIVACAGINTPASITAAMLLIIFHAVSKSLLFMCVGTIEQKIGSRDIEDMRGLFKVMPRTALITAVGIFTMLLPPFGMLLAKWMAVESALNATAMPVLVLLLAAGSALTVLFWARWAGCLLFSANPRLEVGKEEQDAYIRRPLAVMAAASVLLSLLAPLMYIYMIEPVALFHSSSPDVGYQFAWGAFYNHTGVFAIYPLYLLLGLGFFFAWRTAKKSAASGDPVLPYLGGIQAEKDGQAGFIGPMNVFVEPTASNYYLASWFGEESHSKIINTAAVILLVMMFGGVL